MVLHCVCGLLGAPAMTVTIEIKNNNIRKCTDCPLMCDSDMRIQLNTYKYNDQNVHDPTVLFSRCSWQDQCSIDITLIKSIMNRTPDGELVIKYTCKGLATERGICKTSMETITSRQINLIYQNEALSDIRPSPSMLTQSCTCHITGQFKIKIRDLRLPHGVTTNSVSVNICKEGDPCIAEHFNSSNRARFNGAATKHVTSSDIYLENVPIKSMPISSLIVWIQITEEGRFSIDCSIIESTQTTTAAVTTAVTTGLDTSPSTVFSKTRLSTQPQEEVTTLSVHASVPMATSTERTSSRVSTHENPIPGANRGGVGEPGDSTVPIVGVVVPVVLVIIGSACAMGAIVIYRRRRKRNTNMTNSIVNQSYEDTTDDLHIPPVSDKMRPGSVSFDSGIPETNTDYTNVDAQADYQYNIIDNYIDDEYNKISFQQTPIPFDQNYGHVPTTNPVQDKEYDHVDGVPELDMQTYSHVNQQVLKDEPESKLQSTNKPADQKTQHRVDSTYDHLALSNGKESQDFDELQGDDYSHLPSSGAVTTHTKPRLGHRDRNDIKPNGLSDTTDQINESKDTEHAYFVIESDNNASMPPTESNTSDTAVHPYFILEPKANLPYTQIVKDLDETAEHSYFTLEPNAHNIKH